MNRRLPLLRQFKRLGRNLAQSLLYRMVRNGKPAFNPRSVLFVCKGNICRSVFAEHALKNMPHGKQIAVRSCGLDVKVSSPSPDTARNVARSMGYDLDGHRSRQVETRDLDEADLVIAMEFWQYRELRARYPHRRKEIRLLREYAPFPENLLCNIPDPFGQNERSFHACFTLIQRALENACSSHLFPGRS